MPEQAARRKDASHQTLTMAPRRQTGTTPRASARRQQVERPAAGPAETLGSGAVECPFCRGREAEMVSLFGSQLIVSQFRCRRCGAYFESVREDR